MENKNSKLEKILYDIFEVGIGLKFFNGLWELFSGSALLILSKENLGRFFYFLARREFLEDPNDWLVNTIFKFLENISHETKMFAAIYILSHSLLNLFVAIELYKGKIRAYIISMTIMTIMIIYQIHRIILHHSIVLSIITFFDILFIILTWHEYQRKIKVV